VLIERVSPRTRVTVWWLGTFVVAAIVISAVAAAVQRGDVFSFATNILFLWPIALAWMIGADSTAIVLILTLTASLFHHSCDHMTDTRETLAVWVYVVLALSYVALAVLHSSIAGRRHERAWSVGVALVFVLLAILAIVFVVLASHDRVDGCLYVHEPGDTYYLSTALPHLRRVWCLLDDTAALAVVAAVLIFFTRAPSLASRNVGHFWLAVAIALVVHAYTVIVRVSLLGAYLVLTGAFIVIFVPRLIVSFASRGCGHPFEALAAALVLIVASVDFIVTETTWAHGVWHVLVAFGVAVLIDASRRRSVGGGGGESP
jgi:hypothetical protein